MVALRRDISPELAVTTEMDGLIAIIDLRNDNFVLMTVDEAKALKTIVEDFIDENELAGH